MTGSAVITWIVWHLPSLNAVSSYVFLRRGREAVVPKEIKKGRKGTHITGMILGWNQTQSSEGSGSEHDIHNRIDTLLLRPSPFTSVPWNMAAGRVCE